MALIERHEFNIYEGEDEYGEAVSWHRELEDAKDDLKENYDTETHCIVKVTYYCNDYEVVS